MSVILEMENICKQFPGVLANDRVCFSVKKGEVHALLGENGAGKSTLMNILCGLYKPTSGEIRLEGELVQFSSARDAMELGIGMVHQHFMLVPTMTVTENCPIGDKEGGSIKLDRKEAGQRLKELAERYGMEIDPDAIVGTLSVGEMQRVEIIKALFRGAKILILDEPTAVLTPQEARALFKMIRALTDNQFTVIFISHKLDEVKEISDRVTVLRLGAVVGTHDIAQCSIEELARLMVGREIIFDVVERQHPVGDILLEVNNLSLHRLHSHESNKLLDDLSFEIHEGEILGIAGVDGNGQAELVECLTGIRKASSGEAIYQEKDLLHLSTRDIMSHDVSHIPQDRQKTGLVMPMTLVENFALQDYYKTSFGKRGFLNWTSVEERSSKLIQDFSIKTPSAYELAQNLSGGNQQKVVAAREISREPKLLIAMHPTRGLDVGAVEYIHNQLIDQRDEGVGIMLVSTELEEIMRLSDRIIVLYEGRAMGCVRPSETTIEEMGLMMGGRTLDEIRNGRVKEAPIEDMVM